MYIVYGSRLMGKTDVVPGLFHVATKFGHIYYLPLIPTGSYVVLGEDSKNFRGVSIGLSFRSIFTAWLRVGLFLVAMGFSVAVLVAAIDERHRSGNPIQLGVVAVALWFAFGMSWHKIFTRASYNRACQLGQIVGLNAQAMEILNKVYGQASSRGFEVAASALKAAPAAAQPRVIPAQRSASVSAAPARPLARQQKDTGAIPLEPEAPASAPTARAKPRPSGQIGL
jgi:hypothetical protein